MNIDYIIVQAGGKGTRLGYLTENKPKALVPVENLPMLFHIFRKFPDKRFIIIADYKKEVLREYLHCFANVQYQVADADGSGTCAGIKQALDLLPENTAFMLIWSDLVLTQKFTLPEEEQNYIGIAQTFLCRWSYSNGVFTEENSERRGVAGLFIFRNKTALAGIPREGEFVRWLKASRIRFNELGLAGTKEFGRLSEYEKLGKEKCRPFNKITTDGNILTKEGIDEQGKQLALRESRWYQAAVAKNVGIIPKIHQFEPLSMEYIKGKNIHEYVNLRYEEKLPVLKKLADALKDLHSLERIAPDVFSLREAYYGKTMERLNKIRDLIPFANNKTIVINKRECRNVYFYKRELEKKLEKLPCDSFHFIHGDCTFSNIMLRGGIDPVLIDPRGYFGFTELYGDPLYDWAKLYYSIVGNYDRFNLKEFHLALRENSVELEIESNHWEDMEQDFYTLSGTQPQSVKLLHAVIWLSLTTYAWQDYDSVCGAFYNGLYYLEEIL